ncbi:MAG: SCO family protein [Cellvibrionaceae bacterium]
MKKTQKSVIKTVSLVGLFIVFIVGAFVFKMTQPRILHVKELVSMGVITYQKPKEISPFELIDHNKQAFTKESLKGHWTMLFFGFSNCGGFCPATLAILNVFMNEIDSEVRDQTEVVMISVDPARDTPEALAEYMAKFNSDFTGVTGDFLTTKRVSNQFHIGFQKSDKNEENYEVSHGEQIILINPEGEYYGFIKTPFTVGKLKVAYQSIVLSHKP